MQNIKDITETSHIISISGIIIDVKPTYEFKRKDGTKGYVKTIIVSDITGTIRVALWGQHAKSIKETDVFRLIEINNGYVKKGKFENVEINCFSNTVITLKDIDENEIREFLAPFINIKDISSEQKRVNVQGTIVKINEKRIVKNKNNNEVNLQSFTISDNTAMIRVTCWGDNTKKLVPFKEGDIIEIINAVVKSNDNYEIELLIYSDTVIKRKIGLRSNYGDFVPGTLANVVKKMQDIQTIENIKEGTNAIVQGTIINVVDKSAKLSLYCPQCNARLEKSNQKYICKTHGIVKEPIQDLEIEFIINDGTASLIIAANKRLLAQLINIPPLSKKENLNIASQLYEVLPQLIHLEVEITGLVTLNEHLGHFKMLAQTIEHIQYNDSIRRIIQRTFV